MFAYVKYVEPIYVFVIQISLFVSSMKLWFEGLACLKYYAYGFIFIKNIIFGKKIKNIFKLQNI